MLRLEDPDLENGVIIPDVGEVVGGLIFCPDHSSFREARWLGIIRFLI
jgi:hypothetical protein